ncbi:hypothetical protein DRQ33_04015, partial [bacterium]
PHLIYGSAQNSDSSPIPEGCGSFIAYPYPAADDTLTEESSGCSFDGSDWAVQIADFDLSTGDTVAIWLFNTCNGETALVLVELDYGVPAQNIGTITLQTGYEVITVLYPNGGESFMFGAPINIQWTASPAISTVNIFFSANSGSSWTSVASGISAAASTFPWNAPEIESDHCLIKVVSGMDTSVYDQSDAFFEIVPNPEIELVIPVGGEIFYFGDTIDIQWIGQAIEGVSIHFSSDNGASWVLVQDSLAITSSYYYIAPEIESENCLIRARAIDDTTIMDISGLFTIQAPPDTIPPAAIDDLSADTVLLESIYFSWTITGDDEYDGIVTEVDLRYYNSPITEANWDICTSIGGVPAPETSGTVQGMWVDELLPGETYYFAIKVADEVPNWSDISNVVEVIMPEAEDTIPPGEFTLTADAVDCSSTTIIWLAPGDDDYVGIADHYEFRYADFELDSANFADGTLVEDVPAPMEAGTEQSFYLNGLDEETHYWVAGYAFDEMENVSPIALIDFITDTCPTPVDTVDTIAPARITTLDCNDFSPSGIQLTWMAVGDDVYSGTAFTYEIRYSTESFYPDEWDEVPEFPVEMLPHTSGTIEYYWVTGLESATEYWFAVFAIDEVGNRSQMSNLAHCITMGVINPVEDVYTTEDSPDFLLADLFDVFVPTGLDYSVDYGPGLVTYRDGIDSNEVWVNLNPDFHGETYVYLYAYHGGYIVGDTVEIFVEHENDAPVFTCDPPDSIAIPGVLFEYEFTAVDGDGDSIWFFMVNSLDSMYLFDDGTFMWMPPEYLGEGHYDITVAVTDGYDTTMLTFPVYVMKITNPIFAPINLIAHSGFLGSIPLTWQHPQALDLGYPVHLIGYEVYRSEMADSGFESIGTCEMNTFNDPAIECGETYYYTVRAIYDSPDAHSSQSNVASGACNDESGRVYSSWVLVPIVLDGYLDDYAWQLGSAIDFDDMTFCFVNTADRLFGYIQMYGAVDTGADFSMWFDDDNSNWWDALPSDEGRFIFRFADEIGNYFQPVADVGGTATRGTITPISSAASTWRETGDGVILEFSIPLNDDEHLGSLPCDSLGFMLTGKDSATTYFNWLTTSTELDPATYGRLILGCPGGVPEVVVFPTSFEITMEQDNTGDISLSIQNFGDAVGYFEITGLPEWISTAIVSDYIYPMGIVNLPLTINTADMEPGDYVGEVILYTTNPENSEVVVEIVLHITPGEPSNYLVISVPSVTYATEDEIIIPVCVGNIYDNDITRVRFTIHTNPDVILPDGANGGEILPEDWSVMVTSIGEGHITVELSGTTPLPTSGEIAQISYSVEPDAEEGYSSRVDLRNGLVNSGSPIPILTNGILIIGEQVFPYWSAMIYLESEGGLPMDSASFGLHQLATDNYDRVIDKLDPPPMPEAGNIYFVSADSYKLTRDLRHLGDRELIYPVVTNSDGKIKWDINRIWSGCFIGDTLDMKSVGSISVTAGDTVYIYYHYESPVEITVHLERGWNLISIPLGSDSIIASAAFPDMLGEYIFYFDQITRSYNIATAFKPGRAYWIFNAVSGDYTVSGPALRKYEFSLHQGWFMLGAPTETAYWLEQPVQPEDALIRDILLGYDEVAHGYYNSNILEPTEGYWIYVLENCTLKISTIYLNP